MNDLFTGNLRYCLGRVLVVQLGLGLSLETGVGMFDRYDCRHSVPDVRAGKIAVLFLEDADLPCVVIDHLGEDSLESGQVGAALRVVDIVAEAKDVFMEFVDELECRFHGNVVAHALIINNVRHGLLGFIERANKPDDPVRLMKDDLLCRRLTQVGILDGELRIEIGRLVHAALDIFLTEPGLLKDLGIRQEIDPRSGPFGLSNDREKSVHKLNDGISPLIFVLIKKTAAANADGHSFRKSIDHRRSDAVQSSAGLICIIIKFSACMERRKDDTLCAHAFFMHTDRDSSSVVLHGAGSVLFQRHSDRRAETGEVLIHGVIHDLVDQMVESSCGHASDIHAGSCADSFKSFQYFNTVRIIIIRINICSHAISYSS